jgi:secondary thiamine-phosphate synthase enzyme
MMIRKITVQSSQKTEAINVTEQLAAMIGDVEHGLAHFNVPHTTAALIICEDDVELRDDLVRAVENLLADLRPFKHARKSNPNAEAHIISALAGTTLVLAIEDSKFDLGTYQNVLFLEMDGPRRRNIHCTVFPAR